MRLVSQVAAQVRQERARVEAIVEPRDRGGAARGHEEQELVRVDSHAPPDTASYNQLKGQIASEILQRRQQEFLQAWSNQQRLEAKIQDFRTP